MSVRAFGEHFDFGSKLAHPLAAALAEPFDRHTPNAEVRQRRQLLLCGEHIAETTLTNLASRGKAASAGGELG